MVIKKLLIVLNLELYENTPKHPPSPRSEHLILPSSIPIGGLLDG